MVAVKSSFFLSKPSNKNGEGLVEEEEEEEEGRYFILILLYKWFGGSVCVGGGRWEERKRGGKEEGRIISIWNWQPKQIRWRINENWFRIKSESEQVGSDGGSRFHPPEQMIPPAGEDGGKMSLSENWINNPSRK